MRHLTLVVNNKEVEEEDDEESVEPDWIYHPSYYSNLMRNTFRLVKSDGS